VTGGRLFSAGTPVSSNKTDRQDEILSIVETVGKYHKPTPTKKKQKNNKTNKKTQKKNPKKTPTYICYSLFVHFSLSFSF
jgi:hypothetical protein